MPRTSRWIRAVSVLVPADLRRDWTEEWEAELATAGRGMTHAWGALADAWYLRTEGWTMGAMGRDLRSAVRSLTRRPFFTALAGVTLAVGIGANVAIYTVVDSVLLNPLPFPEPKRLVSYNHEAPGLGVKVPVVPHSEAMYLHYSENARAIESFAVFEDVDVSLITDGEPRRLDATMATRRYFDVLGVAPLLGRGFAEGEDRAGAEPVAVLGHALWADAFGGDPTVVGRSVELDGVPHQVVGVMPPGFGLVEEELWIPMRIDPADPAIGSLGLIGVARLADGATIEAAEVEMEALLGRLAERYPDELGATIIEQARLGPDIEPLKDVFVEDMRQALWVMLGTVGLVLLIACANVANLFLVRAEGRRREEAVRTALGASRLDVVRRYVAESLTLALGAGLLGLALASLGLRGLLRIAPADLPNVLAIGIDGSVLAFAAAVSVAAGLVFGLFPALGRARGDLSGSLKDGGRASTAGRQRHRTRSGLVVAQVALALVLMVGSGLMLRSFFALRDVDPGFDSDELLTFRFSLPRSEYDQPREVLEFHRRLIDRLAAMPGVRAAGMINGLPLSGSKSAGPMEPEDRPFAEGQLGPVIERRNVTPGFFEAMEIPVLDGRAPAWDDQADGLRGVVISASLAASFWPAESAVGRRIRDQGGEHGWEVVGVVGDVRHDAVRDEPMPVVYLPVLAGAPDAPGAASQMDVVVKVASPLDAIPGARDALRELDPKLPMINPRTVEAVVRESMSSMSFTALMLGIAASIALLLGTVGIYGVISYVVSRRTQEIGVRMALGAPAGRVLGEVMRQGLVLSGIGVALGLAGAWGLSKALASLLYGVSATDPVTFAGTAGLIAGVAMLATWLPARRASRVDPIEALRTE